MSGPSTGGTHESSACCCVSPRCTLRRVRRPPTTRMPLSDCLCESSPISLERSLDLPPLFGLKPHGHRTRPGIRCRRAPRMLMEHRAVCPMGDDITPASEIFFRLEEKRSVQTSPTISRARLLTVLMGTPGTSDGVRCGAPRCAAARRNLGVIVEYTRCVAQGAFHRRPAQLAGANPVSRRRSALAE
jgi:hypothetical protein